MSQAVLAGNGDDNPPDETISFVHEGDAEEAAEHLDDELGLKQELENGDDRLIRAMPPPDMLAMGRSYRGGGMPMLQPCPPYTPVAPPIQRMSHPPPLAAATQPMATMAQDPNQSWAGRGHIVHPSVSQSVVQYAPGMNSGYAPNMNSGLPRLQHHPQPRFYGQYPMQPMQPGGMHGQMGLMMQYQQQLPQGGMVMQQPGYPPPVQQLQGPGMIPMTQTEMSQSPHVKKPLNAFMLYMKEMRQHVVKECTLKESAAINQILGRKWHALDRTEQAKYYEMARRERALHQQLFPGWSARDNYAIAKKKKKKRDKSHSDAAALKKCRARYGLDQQQKWCKPCRRKKKCIRFTQPGDCPSGDEGEVVVDVTVREATDVAEMDRVDNDSCRAGGDIDHTQTLGEGTVEGQGSGENQTVDIIVVNEES